MKVWQMYGSEHSANLVMIGHFKEIADASRAKETIDKIIARVRDEEAAGRLRIGETAERYSDQMLDCFKEVEIFTVSHREVEQFTYEVTIKARDRDLVLTTDEMDISAFLKVLIDEGARVEVYSAHDYPDTGHGRGQ